MDSFYYSPYFYVFLKICSSKKFLIAMRSNFLEPENRNEAIKHLAAAITRNIQMLGQKEKTEKIVPHLIRTEE